MNDRVLNMHRIVERHLNEIAPLFTSGMRLTFIARNPANNEQDVLITVDDLGELGKLIERSRDRVRAT